MEIEESDFVFQTSSSIVREIYNTDNFLIEYNDKEIHEKRCVVYFSSNDIYYPNSEDVFRKKILDKNFYEWYNTRIIGVYKHIFVRDIQKQWYLEGINDRINSPELLCEFLRAETRNYSVIMLGSSAGGYAAVLYGSLLSAEKVFSFNGQFELSSLLQSSNPSIDPILFKNVNTPLLRYFDLRNFIGSNVDIFYFSSLYSKWDYQQYNHVKDLESIKPLLFKTSHHGVPFVKSALHTVINMSSSELLVYKNKNLNPISFSISRVGILSTFRMLAKQLISKIKKWIVF